MKRILGVTLAFVVMAGSMALAGQTHMKRDHHRAHLRTHHHARTYTTTRTIRHRGGSQTITYYHYAKQKGDRDHDKDDKRPGSLKRRVQRHRPHQVWWRTRRVVRRRVIVRRHRVVEHRRIVHHNRGRHRGWWIGRGNRRHHH